METGNELVTVQASKSTDQVLEGVRVAEEQKTRERESTRARKAIYLQLYESTLNSPAVICRHMQISRGTYYNWLKGDAEFKLAIEMVKHTALDELEDTVIKKAVSGDMRAAIFVLKNKHGDYKDQRCRECAKREQAVNSPIIPFEEIANDVELCELYFEKTKAEEAFKKAVKFKRDRPDASTFLGNHR